MRIGLDRHQGTPPAGAALNTGSRPVAGLPFSHTYRGDPVSNNKVTRLNQKAVPPLDTPTDLSEDAVKAVSEALNIILADSYALYLKTKNFHWHVSGPHFRDYHLLFDEQAEAIIENSDDVAERVRKIGGTTLRSIGQISRLQTLKDNEEEFVPPSEMLRELMNDNKKIVEFMRKAHEIADEHEDVATASLIEVWIDQAEKRTWFLFEASRAADNSGH
jgi:starvation-inducible DNA-binding protein